MKLIDSFEASFYRIIMLVLHRGYGTSRWKRKFRSFGEGSEIVYPPLSIMRENISIGKETKIMSYARMQNFKSQSDDSPSIIIGDRCYFNFFFTILNGSRVEIGNDVLIASHVIITSENHGMDPESEVPYMDQPLVSSPIRIGDGCWIGEKVCILPGVTIGKKCIIGAGSMVTKSIPDYCIAVGNPAKVIKKYNFKTHTWEKV